MQGPPHLKFEARKRSFQYLRKERTKLGTCDHVYALDYQGLGGHVPPRAGPVYPLEKY